MIHPNQHHRLPIILVALASVAGASGCLPYLTNNRSEVIITGIDVDQTLDVAAYELEGGGPGSVLTIWAVRDQVLTAQQARRVSELYLEHIDDVDADRGRGFNVWHLTWAISNMYRHGDDTVRSELQGAYDDAERRVDQLGRRVARVHFHGEELAMGDAHGGGRAYAEGHLVVPGNCHYLQSSDQFFAQQRARHQEASGYPLPHGHPTDLR